MSIIPKKFPPHRDKDQPLLHAADDQNLLLYALGGNDIGKINGAYFGVHLGKLTL
jgi:hypothetical protein